MNINKLTFSISQNCQLTSLGSVSCPMGGLGYVDSHESHYWSSVEILAAWLGVERNGKGVEYSYDLNL